MNSGIISCIFPTIPKSATLKIGASASLLTATIVSEEVIPTRCWIAPEIPNAMYSVGATVFPDWPTCCGWGNQPRSTRALEPETVPSNSLASSSTSLKFSLLPIPRPTETRIWAFSMLMGYR